MMAESTLLRLLVTATPPPQIHQLGLQLQPRLPMKTISATLDATPELREDVQGPTGQNTGPPLSWAARQP